MLKFISLLLIPAFALANPIDDNCPEHVTKGAPISQLTDTQYICHLNYAVHYRFDTKTAEYVVEHLDAEDISGKTKRKDAFRPDPLVDDAKEASLDDYKGAGYDRGHLSPAANNSGTKDQMSESFFLTNMIPQNKYHNRGIWRILELGVRDTAKTNDVYVISGTIYDKGYLTIGNNVGVPTRIWKVVYNATTNETIAFLFPNDRLETKDMPKYVVTVDQIEKETGLNLFPELDESVESKADINKWSEIK